MESRGVGRKLLWSTVISVVLFFGLLEGALRLYYHPNGAFRFEVPKHERAIMQPDPDLGYRLQPNYRSQAYGSYVETNSRGLRGPEFDPIKPKGKRRIIALGDSCTFGFGATDNAHTYPAQLRALFEKAGQPVEIINAGVVGYTSSQALKQMEKELLAYAPDQLLIYIGWNDQGISLLPNWRPHMISGLQPASISPPYTLIALAELRFRFLSLRNYGFKDEALNVYAANLVKMVQLARAHGVEPVIITWPTIVISRIATIRNVEIFPGTGVTYQSWVDFYQKYQAKIHEVAQRENVRRVLLAEAFSQIQTPAFYWDEVHLSDLGNAQAARVIFEALSTSNH